MSRHGRRNRPYYRIVVTDSRTARDGRVIESLGTYDPLLKDAAKKMTLRADRYLHWVSAGARPSEALERLVKHTKALERQATEMPAAKSPSAE